MTLRIPPRPGSSKSEVYSIDFRETAPALSNETMFVDNPVSALFGGLSVAVPGEVRGLQEAYQRWGSLPWKRLVDPSVALANGWEVDKELGRRLPVGISRVIFGACLTFDKWFSELMLNNPDWSAVFAPDGRLLKEGEIIRRTKLARTLSVIGEEGPDVFYKVAWHLSWHERVLIITLQGPIADSIVRKVRATGGILSHEDMETYSVKVERALEGTYRGRKIYTTHAPTSGPGMQTRALPDKCDTHCAPVLLHMFNLVERYDFTERNSLNAHRLVEAMKFGFAARLFQSGCLCFILSYKAYRTELCDPEFATSSTRINEIPTKAFAAVVASNITDVRSHDIPVSPNSCHG
jgi:gamma-glutamyltranspeptidase/glutathione hydrolase/leukotriene-C4 hydrolase